MRYESYIDDRGIKKTKIENIFNIDMAGEYSGKIIVEDDRTVSWLWDPAGVRKILANPKLVVR
jgi:hypothetical protein